MAGVIILLSLINTCQRFPELVLEVTTDSIAFLPDREYQFTGSIESFGQEPVTQHGFCWSESSNPTTDGDASQLGARDSRGKFTSIVSNLYLSTEYFVRSYVLTSAGIEYGDEKSFITPAPVLPLVSTKELVTVTPDSVLSGGTITNDGGASIRARGICWDTTSPPTLDHNYTTDGTGMGSFTSKITGLECSTKYYIRAYATNQAGTAYGDTVSFISAECPAVLPTVITASIDSIEQSSAWSGGNVTDEGSSSVSVKGVCWSESPKPTLSDNYTEDGAGLGTFTSILTGLEPNTRYYVRAYATNSEGSAFGDDESFTTSSASSETVTDFDDNVYGTVQIGDQVWMKENLKVTHYSDGTPIPLVESNSAWEALNDIDKGYCWYDNSTTNKDLYGGLYTWTTAVNGASSTDTNPSGIQGVCPNNWHLPSDVEWKQLEIHLGLSPQDADLEVWRGTDEGGKMKSTDELWDDPNTAATNESGFTGIPAGYRKKNGNYADIGCYAVYWSATQSDPVNGWHRNLLCDHGGIYRYYYDKRGGFSVRCIKD